jgi:transcriptional regulator with XRE-family HTH domain
LPSETAVVKALGQRIRELRDAKGWSQERLAEAAYLDRSYLAGIERGLRNPSVRSLLKIAGALKVRIGELFSED